MESVRKRCGYSHFFKQAVQAIIARCQDKLEKGDGFEV